MYWILFECIIVHVPLLSCQLMHQRLIVDLIPVAIDDQKA